MVKNNDVKDRYKIQIGTFLIQCGHAEKVRKDHDIQG